MRILATCLAIAAFVAAPASAQPVGADDGQSARAQRMKQGAEAARGPQIGEGNPIPEPRRTYTAEERAAAHRARRSPPAPVATPQAAAPAPARSFAWFTPERAAARAPYEAEAVRANKAGEIRSRGESSY